jgi:TolB protein
VPDLAMRWFAYSLLVLAACRSSERAGPGRADPEHSSAAHAGHEHAASGLDMAAVARLPGVLWFVEDGPPRRLVRLAAGARRAIEGELFPSPSVLPDGRLVAIASRGDGSAESEQLALVAADGTVERIGPAGFQVRDPAVDPDGRWIAFAANLDGHSDLYRVELATSAVTRLTTEPLGNFRPAILGDGLVYVSSRDGDSEIYRMSGRTEQRLTAFHRDDWQPTPAPDGKTIAFLSDREGPPRIFLMAPDGTQQRRLTRRTAGEETDPVWSPDGRYLAYLVDQRVRVRELTSGDERELTPLGTADHEPAWSPDGRWLAVSRVRGHASDLWALPLDGSPALRVAAGARLPRWR